MSEAPLYYKGIIGKLRERPPTERKFFIDNLLVRVHFITEMIWWTGLCEASLLM